MNNDETPLQVPEPDIEQPTERSFQTPMESPQPAPVKPVRSKKPLLIILSVLLFIAALGAAYFFWYLPSQPVETPVDKPVAHESHMMDAKETITLVTEHIAKTPNVITRVTTGTSPAYQPADSPTYVKTTDAPSSEIAHNDATAEDDTDHGTPLRNEMATFLTETHGFRDTTTSEISADTTELQTDDVICAINSNVMGAVIACEDKASYTDAATSLRPFGTAMASTDKNNVLSNLEIKKSQTDGYEVATAAITSYSSFGGAAGLFYKKSGNDWQFFKASQTVLQCSDYSTDDLKNAYAGEPCGDDSGQPTTVQAVRAE